MLKEVQKLSICDNFYFYNLHYLTLYLTLSLSMAKFALDSGSFRPPRLSQASQVG